MAALPDLDDLLDQIEGSVSSGAQPLVTGRRGFFDPVPCFSTSRAAGASTQSDPNGSAKNAAEIEEKLSFVEFLKVTAKEAEELHQLQRLHDSQQETRGSKRVGSGKAEEREAAPVPSHLTSPPAPANKWEPPTLVVPEMPDLPDVPDGLPQLQQQNGRAAEGGRKAVMEESATADKENRLQAEYEETGRDNPSFVNHQLPRLETPSPDLGVEMGEEAELEQRVQPPTPSPEPCLIAVEEQLLQPAAQHSPVPEMQLVQQQEDAVPAAEAVEGGADEEFDEVLAYLAKCDGGSAAAPSAVEESTAAAAAVAPAASPAAAAAEPEPAPPSPIAITPPTCNTAASFDVVSFQVLPSDAMDESEMERELNELAQDFPDSDQPEIVRNEELNATADETFYSAVESLDRTVSELKEEEDGEENAKEEIKEHEEMKEEETHEDGATGDEEETDEQERKADSDIEDETLPEERQEVDLVFVNQSSGDERVAELEDANRECVEVSIVVETPPASTEKEEKMEDDLPVVVEREEEEENKKDEEKEEAPLVSPSISGSSAASMEVLERADVEQMEQEMRVEETNGKIEEEDPEVIEEAEPILDTVADEKEPIDEAEDTVEAVIDPAPPAEILLEPVPEFAAVEEAGDSMAEEEEGMLREEGDEERGQDPPPCYEVAVEDRPEDPSPAAVAAAAARAARFRDRVISDVHEIDGDEAPAMPSRLTESELQLGKTPPIWIPDAECPACMLCSARFTFLLRRHHCRACGRVLCSACCGERMVLAYQPDKGKARVCSPCASTLQRVEELEKEREGSPETTGSGSNATDTVDPEAAAAAEGAQPVQQPQVGQQLQVEFGPGGMRKKSILKVRAASVSTEEGVAQGGPTPSLTIPGQRGGEENTVGPVIGSAPRGVVFRDGIKPGEHTPDELAREEEERQAGGRMQPQLRKKSRKRAAVSRRVAALKVEEQLASALPTHARPDLLVVQGGVRVWSSLRDVELSLAEGDCVRIAVNRLLTVAVQICQAPYGEGRVMCAVSHGFHALGLDEVVFCWRLDPSSIREDEEEYGEEMGEESKRKMRAELPITVVRRIEEILQACFTSSDLADVRRMATRMPRLHTSIAAESDDETPMTRHTMLVPATHQSTRHLPLSPSLPFVFAVPIHQSELPWALAAPNRVLLRLGLASGCYPTPLIIDPSRDSVYSEETSSSVLKMFNDIGTWSYRMQHVVGGTVALSNEETTVRIPRHARQQMRKIVEINRNMLAWLCDVNTEADSHLICIETEQGMGPYESNIFQKGGDRKKTGATFVIIDGALKTTSARVQVSVCEDGIAVRLSSEGLVELINMLLDGKDHTVDSGTHRLRVEWTDVDEPSAGTQLVSPIDGLYLGNKMQYGLTLERVISSTVASPSLPDTASRLSHVFNMRENLIPPEDEAKVFSVAELVANEAAGMVDEYLPLLTTIGVDTLALRLTVERERIEYEVADWAGLETEQTRFRASLDKLVPVFVNVLGYIPHGFSIELWISIVSTTPLPIEI